MNGHLWNRLWYLWIQPHICLRASSLATSSNPSNNTMAFPFSNRSSKNASDSRRSYSSWNCSQIAWIKVWRKFTLRNGSKMGKRSPGRFKRLAASFLAKQRRKYFSSVLFPAPGSPRMINPSNRLSVAIWTASSMVRSREPCKSLSPNPISLIPYPIIFALSGT